MDSAENAAPQGSTLHSAASSDGARAVGAAADAVVPPAAPYVTDDAAIATAAQDIAALGARVETAIGSAKNWFSDADAEIAALRGQVAVALEEIASLRQQRAASEHEIALLRRQQAEAETATSVQWTKAEDWRKDFDTSNRMLIDALDRVALRVIAAAEPDPSADAAAPEVSIVMPVWNRADLVGTAIRSVLAQSFRGWELIVIDDGSTDDLEGALRPFRADPRIRVLRQANRGECWARNRGLGEARGAIIAYLDSDNFWYPDFLAAAVAVFRADPELEIAFGGISYEWPNGDVRFYLLPYSREALLRDNLADMNVIVHRRRAFERYGGFDERLKRALEWDLMLRYTVERPAAHISVVGARYRIIPGARISTSRPLAPSVFRVRSKWWSRPDVPPRVLYVTLHFPQLSESYIYAEIACMRRFGAEVELYAPNSGASPFEHDIKVHRGALADAIRAVNPDVIHVHWFTLLDEHRATLAAAGVPITVRGHSFDGSPALVRKALELPLVQRCYLLPGSASSDMPCDGRLKIVPPFFDTSLFRPAARKDRKLVLRASVCQPQNGVAFMLDLAKRLPEHRVVLALAHSTGMVEYVEAMRALKREIASPAELMIDVQRPEMAALFGEAAIYVHTATLPDDSIHKLVGGPVSAAEAMATGAYVLVRNAPALVRYVGDAGTAYRDVDDAAALIRATESWTEEQWRQAQSRSIERAFGFHADELVLRPVFDDWCALAKERREASKPAAPI